MLVADLGPLEPAIHWACKTLVVNKDVLQSQRFCPLVTSLRTSKVVVDPSQDVEVSGLFETLNVQAIGQELMQTQMAYQLK